MSDDPNIPTIQHDNLFLADPVGQKLWPYYMGAESFSQVRGHFETLGRIAAEVGPLADRADKQGPILRTHDPAGNRIDTVEYHPDYHRLEELAYGNGIVSIKYDEAFLKTHRPVRHLVGFGGCYYFSQTETGLVCPVCMTDGVGRVLELHGTDDVSRDTLAHLGSPDRAELWQGAMFLTEKQGGSDVGANRVQARRENGRWLLSGDKWFCSNVDAEVILALARMPDGKAGTKGLGLFLVLRHRPAGNAATIRIERLKDKLGVRSMPTGEVTLEGTEGFLVGGVGDGFKQMTEMLNLSRLYNAVASAAGMRRAVLEAAAYGAGRRAFGHRLWELPLWRATMADLSAEQIGYMLLTFEAVRALDRADVEDYGGAESGAAGTADYTGDGHALMRLLIPMAKALGGKAAVFAVSEAMEAIGGNAYIEEHILPRLLRDVQVLPIWEGTTNILTLDSMRAIQRENSGPALAARAERALAAAEKAGVDSESIGHVRERLSNDANYLQWLAAQEGSDQQRAGRAWLESAGRSMTLALLLETARDDSLRETSLAAFRRLRARPHITAPPGAFDAVALADTEEPLLQAAYANAG